MSQLRHETSSCEETQHNRQPGDYQVTRAIQHALLTAKAPMGGPSGAAGCRGQSVEGTPSARTARTVSYSCGVIRMMLA
jgi:hypothetical protein